jgi:hypothetical protein
MKMAKKFYGCLPSGEETSSVRKYVKEWKSLAVPIEKATGARLHGLDPSLSFITKDGQSVTLPVSFVQALNEALKEKI